MLNYYVVCDGECNLVLDGIEWDLDGFGKRFWKGTLNYKAPWLAVDYLRLTVGHQKANSGICGCFSSIVIFVGNSSSVAL